MGSLREMVDVLDSAVMPEGSIWVVMCRGSSVEMVVAVDGVLAERLRVLPFEATTRVVEACRRGFLRELKLQEGMSRDANS